MFCPTFRLRGFSYSGRSRSMRRRASVRSAGKGTYQARPGASLKLAPTSSASIGSVPVVSVSIARVSAVRMF